MKQLVIGLGEVGTALKELLNCDGFDKEIGGGEELTYEVLHICFPYSENFVAEVEKYVFKWSPNIVIVHSSVPVGTCDPHGWTHSPIRGVHPSLKEGITTFVKYFGGKNARTASSLFKQLGVQVTVTETAETTEALKLWDTTQYGIMILLQKEIYAWCIKKGLDPEIIYKDANHTYAIGYETLNRPEVIRPYLNHMDGPIGGHCVIQNAKLLDAAMAELLVDFNNQVELDQKQKEAL